MNKNIVYRKIFLSVISISVGIILLVIFATKDKTGLPYKVSLISTQGKLEWIHKQKKGLKIKLTNNPEFLNYHARFGYVSNIYNELMNVKGREVSILYLPSRNLKDYSQNSSHNVWQINLDGKTIISYEELKQIWYVRLYWVYFVVPILLIGGGYIGWKEIVKFNSK